MKKSLLAFVVFSILGCETYDRTNIDSDLGPFPYGEMDRMEVVTIDSCQYILLNGKHNQQPAITHKGNCKFCATRP